MQLHSSYMHSFAGIVIRTIGDLDVDNNLVCQTRRYGTPGRVRCRLNLLILIRQRRRVSLGIRREGTFPWIIHVWSGFLWRKRFGFWAYIVKIICCIVLFYQCILAYIWYWLLNDVELLCSEEKEAREFPAVVGDWRWGCSRVGCGCRSVEMEG